jgi:hypothetical protein
MDETPSPSPDRDPEVGSSRRGTVAALIVVVLLVLGGLWLTRQMHQSAVLQDCVSSGRTNCGPTIRQ